MDSLWRNCGVCKNQIKHGSIIQKCSISSCRKHVFCSVDCWSVHDSVMGHKNAFAEEDRAPSESNNIPQKRKKILISSKKSSDSKESDLPLDILIVISKLKSYVKAKSGMNTSGDVGEELSKFVRVIVNEGINTARSEGRKTLMARDFKNIKF